MTAIAREVDRPFAFGWGPHRCIGVLGVASGGGAFMGSESVPIAFTGERQK